MVKINVLDKEITLYTRGNEDYICITDIAKVKNAQTTGLIISHWLSTRFTVEFMGVWEKIHNPDFNVTEFSNIKNESGSNGFVLTAKQWRDENPGQKGNIRDDANISQLVCLSNLENLNALFINEGLTQKERLKRLNTIAIEQMKLLVIDHGIQKLEDTNNGAAS